MSNFDLENALRNSLHDEANRIGLELKCSDIHADGKFHYVAVNTKRNKYNKSGSYLLGKYFAYAANFHTGEEMKINAIDIYNKMISTQRT